MPFMFKKGQNRQIIWCLPDIVKNKSYIRCLPEIVIIDHILSVFLKRTKMKTYTVPPPNKGCIPPKAKI